MLIVLCKCQISCICLAVGRKQDQSLVILSLSLWRVTTSGCPWSMWFPLNDLFQFSLTSVFVILRPQVHLLLLFHYHT